MSFIKEIRKTVNAITGKTAKKQEKQQYQAGLAEFDRQQEAINEQQRQLNAQLQELERQRQAFIVSVKQAVLGLAISTRSQFHTIINGDIKIAKEAAKALEQNTVDFEARDHKIQEIMDALVLFEKGEVTRLVRLMEEPALKKILGPLYLVLEKLIRDEQQITKQFKKIREEHQALLEKQKDIKFMDKIKDCIGGIQDLHAKKESPASLVESKPLAERKKVVEETTLMAPVQPSTTPTSSTPAIVNELTLWPIEARALAHLIFNYSMEGKLTVEHEPILYEEKEEKSTAEDLSKIRVMLQQELNTETKFCEACIEIGFKIISFFINDFDMYHPRSIQLAALMSSVGIIEKLSSSNIAQDKWVAYIEASLLAALAYPVTQKALLKEAPWKTLFEVRKSLPSYLNLEYQSLIKLRQASIQERNAVFEKTCLDNVWLEHFEYYPGFKYHRSHWGIMIIEYMNLLQTNNNQLTDLAFLKKAQAKMHAEVLLKRQEKCKRSSETSGIPIAPKFNENPHEYLKTLLEYEARNTILQVLRPKEDNLLKTSNNSNHNLKVVAYSLVVRILKPILLELKESGHYSIEQIDELLHSSIAQAFKQLSKPSYSLPYTFNDEYQTKAFREKVMAVLKLCQKPERGIFAHENGQNNYCLDADLVNAYQITMVNREVPHVQCDTLFIEAQKQYLHYQQLRLQEKVLRRLNHCEPIVFQMAFESQFDSKGFCVPSEISKYLHREINPKLYLKSQKPIEVALNVFQDILQDKPYEGINLNLAFALATIAVIESRFPLQFMKLGNGWYPMLENSPEITAIVTVAFLRHYFIKNIAVHKDFKSNAKSWCDETIFETLEGWYQDKILEFQRLFNTVNGPHINTKNVHYLLQMSRASACTRKEIAQENELKKKSRFQDFIYFEKTFLNEKGFFSSLEDACGLVAAYRLVAEKSTYLPGETKALLEAYHIAQNPTLYYIPVIIHPWIPLELVDIRWQNLIYSQDQIIQDAPKIHHHFQSMHHHLHLNFSQLTPIMDSIALAPKVTPPSPSLTCVRSSRLRHKLEMLEKQQIQSQPLDSTPLPSQSLSQIDLPQHPLQVTQNCNIPKRLSTGLHYLEWRLGHEMFGHAIYVQRGGFLRKPLDSHCRFNEPYPISFSACLNGRVVIINESLEKSTYSLSRTSEIELPMEGLGPWKLSITFDWSSPVVEHTINLFPEDIFKAHFKETQDWAKIKLTTTQKGKQTHFSLNDESFASIDTSGNLHIPKISTFPEPKRNKEMLELFNQKLETYRELLNTKAKATIAACYLAGKDLMFAPLIPLGLMLVHTPPSKQTEAYRDLVVTQMALYSLMKQQGLSNTTEFVHAHPALFPPHWGELFQGMHSKTEKPLQNFILMLFQTYLTTLKGEPLYFDPNEIMKLTQALLDLRNPELHQVFYEAIEDYLSDFNALDGFKEQLEAIFNPNIHNLRSELHALRNQMEFQYGLNQVDICMHQSKARQQNIAQAKGLFEDSMQNIAVLQGQMMGMQTQVTQQYASINQTRQLLNHYSKINSLQRSNFEDNHNNAIHHARNQRNRMLAKAFVGVALGAIFAPLMAEFIVAEIGIAGIQMTETVTMVVTGGFEGGIASAIRATVMGGDIGRETLQGIICGGVGAYAKQYLNPIMQVVATSTTRTALSSALNHEKFGTKLFSNLAGDLAVHAITGSPSDTTQSLSLHGNSSALTKVAQEFPKALLASCISAGVTSIIEKKPLKDTVPMALVNTLAQTLGTGVNAAIKDHQAAKSAVQKPVTPKVLPAKNISIPQKLPAVKTPNPKNEGQTPKTKWELYERNDTTYHTPTSGRTLNNPERYGFPKPKATQKSMKFNVNKTRGLQTFDDFVSKRPRDRITPRKNFPNEFAFNPGYLDQTNVATHPMDTSIKFSINPTYVREPIATKRQKSIGESVLDFFIGPADAAELIQIQTNSPDNYRLIFDIQSLHAFSPNHSEYFSASQPRLFVKDNRMPRGWVSDLSNHFTIHYIHHIKHGTYNAFNNVFNAFTHPLELIKSNSLLAYDLTLGALEIPTQNSMVRWTKRAHTVAGVYHKIAEASGPERAGMIAETVGTIVLAKKICSVGGSALRFSKERITTYSLNNLNNINKNLTVESYFGTPKDRIQHESLKTIYRQGMDLKNPVHIRDLSLRDVINNQYRKNATVGSGSTADAIRLEIATGQLTHNKGHIKKGNNDLRFLKKWLEQNETAYLNDRSIAENVLLDLQDALGDKRWYSKTIVPK